MRGRPDELSNEYYYFTITVLQECFSINHETLDNSYKKLKQTEEFFDKDIILNFKKSQNLGRKNSIKHPDFKSGVASKNFIINLLITLKGIQVKWNNDVYAKKIFLGNEADIMMVLDVLKLISQDNKKNIYNYFKEVIQGDGLKNAWQELTRIRGISDKIAAFIIRDIGLMNIGLSTEEYKYAFPMDTWVRRISHKLGYDSKNLNEVRNSLINKCKKYQVDPLRFAAGLWFLGFHSLDIALEYLDKVNLHNSC